MACIANIIMIMVMVEDGGYHCDCVAALLSITPLKGYVTSFWRVQKDATGTRGNEMNSWKYDMVPNENSWMGTHGNIEIRKSEPRACSGASAAGSPGEFQPGL